MTIQETKKIDVPNPAGDAMGASVASLLEVLEQWAMLQHEENIVIDMHRVTFVHPFFILPLCALTSSVAHTKPGVTFHIPTKLAAYLETVYFPQGFSATLFNDWEAHIAVYATKSYLPACSFPVTAGTTLQREKFLAIFEQIMLKQLHLRGQVVTVIKYLLSEAIDNITDHSGAAAGWIMVQHYPQKGYLDVCIADTGKGIAGSYIELGNAAPESDAHALELAVNGRSTKKITESRGYGIDTSRRMLVDGLNGKYLLFSGNAFYIYTNELEQITPLQGYGWKGTLLALQIPSAEPAGFNYTTYLE
jgi:hypothetical protein